MAFSEEELRVIYGRTDGYCHLCGKKLARRNYGCSGAKSAWEVDHSNAKTSGGTDYGQNLYPACIPCNRSKQGRSAAAIRKANGVRLRRTGVPPKRSREPFLTGVWNDLWHGR